MTKTTYEHVWFAFLDAYGFSAEIPAQSDHRLQTLFDGIQQTIDEARSRVSFVMQFSDSVFIANQAYPNPRDSFETFHALLQKIQSVSLSAGVAMRGAVSFGAITTGPFGCYGYPILRAVAVEKNLKAPVIVIPERELELGVASLRAIPGCVDGLGLELPLDAVETKAGAISGYVVPPPFAKYLVVATRALKSSLKSGPEEVVPAWRAGYALIEGLREPDTAYD